MVTWLRPLTSALQTPLPALSPFKPDHQRPSQHQAMQIKEANKTWSLQFKQGQSGSDGKESPCNAEDLGSIPGLGVFPK